METNSNGSVTGCNGCTGQWCSRHSITKGNTHRRLCATNQRYFDMWESRKNNLSAKPTPPPRQAARLELMDIKEKGRVLWRELFLSVFSSSDLAAWEARIPGYQCGGRCKRFYTNWKSSHIPSFPLSFEWKHSLKSAVNQKLGHPNLALEEARAFWNSQSGT